MERTPHQERTLSQSIALGKKCQKTLFNTNQKLIGLDGVEREAVVELPWAADRCPCVLEAANRVTSDCWYQRRCGAVGYQLRERAWVRFRSERDSAVQLDTKTKLGGAVSSGKSKARSHLCVGAACVHRVESSTCGFWGVV
jgi:hypothetical protein